MKRTCKKCKIQFSITDFPKHDKYITVNGEERQYYSHKCKKCSSKDIRIWCAKNNYYSKRYKRRKKEGKLYKATREEIRRQRDQYGRVKISELRNNYVKHCIRKVTGLRFKDITLEMIEIKREQLKLYRELKKSMEVLNGFNSNRN